MILILLLCYCSSVFLHALRCVWLLWPSSCMYLQERVLCMIVGSCLLHVWARVTATTKTKDVMLLLKAKQRCSCLLIDYGCCLHYVPCLMQLSVAFAT